MKNKKAAVVLCLILVLTCLYVAYKRVTYFPGRFVFVDDTEVVSFDSNGVRSLDHERGYAGVVQGFPHYELTVSPDGKTAAYVFRDHGRLHSIVLRKLVPPFDYRKTERRIDIKKYKIPYCGQSNLEWSPDGKRLAYADTHRLHIMDIATGKVASAELPELDADTAALIQEWERYNRNKTADKATAQREYEHLTQDKRVKAMPEAAKQPLKDAAAALADMRRRDKLSPEAQSIVDSSTAEIRKTLRIAPSVKLWPVQSWQMLYDADLTTDRQFYHTGHTLRWVEGNTILCDNWKLKLSAGTGSDLTLKARKLPVLCEPTLRPYWSPKGDKAVYLTGTDEPGKCLMTVVNDTGGVMRSSVVSAQPQDPPRWSMDGRYVAFYLHEKSGYYFHIYDVTGSKEYRLRVPCSDWVRLDGFHDGWDWDVL